MELGEKKRITKLSLAVICFTIVIFSILFTTDTAYGAEIVASGSCGYGVTYTVDSEGTVVISGNGVIDNYGKTSSPFYSINKNTVGLKKVIIEEGVKRIGTFSFSFCYGIDSFSLPSTLDSVGENAIYCSPTEIIYGGTIEQWISIQFDCSFGEQHSLIINNAHVTSVTIPEGTTTINSHTFCGCYEIKSVKFPSSLESIEGWAFLKCSNLKRLDLPKSLRSIGEQSFHGCSSIDKVDIPDGVTCIPKSAFSNCTNLTSVTIPESVLSIGEAAFCDCTNLKVINIPEKVTRIEANTFGSCSNLNSIDLPEGITTIGEGAFMGTGLQKIVIPDSVESYGKWAFANCGNLKTVTLSSNAKELGFGLFQEDKSLERIVIPEGVTTIGDQTFLWCYGLNDVVVPDSVTSGIISSTFQDSGRTFYVIPGSYAEKQLLAQGKRVQYLCDEEGAEEDYLGFCQKTIAVDKNGTVLLMDYLSTNLSETDYEVSISNSNYMFYNGTIANIGEGEATITVTSKDGKMSSSANLIRLDESVGPSTAITFDEESITIPKGSYKCITADITPNNNGASIEWESNNESVATVNNGLIMALAPGETKIRAVNPDDESIYAECNVVVISPLRQIVTLESFEDFVIKKGCSRKLNYYLYPSDATDIEGISFESDNPAIVDVSADGVLNAKNNGQATITIKFEGIRKQIDVVVVNPLKNLELNYKTYQLKSQSTLQLEATLTPEDTSDTLIEWKSDNEDVATVDDTGLVTAHRKGIATITASSGGISDNCTIVCPDQPMTGIRMSDCVVEFGKIVAPPISYLPSDTSDDRTAVFTSDNETVIAITDDNRLEAKSIGTAHITGTVGDFTDSCTITVIKAEPEIVIPNELEASCNSTLNEVSLPDGFIWEEPDTSVGEAGEKYFKASYIPNDTEHYNMVSGIDIKLEVVHCFNEEWEKDTETHWHTCSCGEKGDETNHVFGAWITIDEPSDENEGIVVRRCEICGYEDSQASHSWYSDYRVDVEATCLSTGLKSIHCRHCDAVKDEQVIDALGHSYAETVVAPTCSQGGYTLHVCGRCGDSYKDNETVATGHDFGEWIIDTDSSCTAEGIQHRECKTCGYTETKGVDKKEHAFASEYTIDKEATCTTDGSKSYHCTNKGCDATTGSVVIPAEGHHYSEWEVRKEATCTEAGELYHTCDVCEAEEAIELPAVGHQWMDKEIVDREATCTEPGSKSIHCKVCNETKPGSLTEVPPKGHSYGSWEVTKDPTCTEEGEKERVCTVCGDVDKASVAATGHKWADKEVIDQEATCTEAGSKSIHCKVCDEVKPDSQIAIPAKGHTYGSWEVTKDPTCTEEGEKERVCDTCGHVDKASVAATGHKWADKEVVDKEATCTEAGSKSIHCKVCDEVKPDSQIAIPAKGHSYGSWEVTKEPTCIAEGEKERVCDTCGHVDKVSISATGHKWADKEVVDKEATCTEAGSKSIHCKVCDEVKPDSQIAIPAKGHTYGSWEVTKDPTCTVEGEKARSCSNCGDIQKETLPATGHHYAETIIAPTCSQGGYTLHVCGRCGDSYQDNETAATGHDFGEWIIDTDSSCTAEGIQHRECKTCGYTETKGVNKKEHVFASEYTIDKAATCTTDGSKSYHCTNEGCTATTGSVVIPAEGHHYSAWNETKKPTCTEPGDAERICSVCGEKETIHFEARGHVWMKDYTVDKEATYEEAGSESIHCAVCDAIDPSTVRTIPKLLIDVANMEYSAIAAMTYTGEEMTPDFTASFNGVSLPSQSTDAFDVVYSDNINAGIATITVTGKGDYTGTKVLHFTINPKSISKWTFPTIADKVYTGSALTPTFTLKEGSTKMVKNTHYTVTYSNNTKVGKAKVVIKGKGNYTGSKTLYFKINPKGTSISSVTAASKGFTVKWAKQSTQTTGYQIYYTTSTTAPNATTTPKATISSTSTVSKKVTGLKGGTKYYVYVRTYKTVNGVKYYSAWSAKKYVTTKK